MKSLSPNTLPAVPAAPSKVDVSSLVIMGVWLLAIAGGIALWTRYDYTPGRPADAPLMWPSSAAVRPSGEKPTLVLLLHPRCDCSFATLDQVQRLLTKVGSSVSTTILFSQPEKATSKEMESELVSKAKKIPGVVVVDDMGGKQGRLFGSYTSGQALLYGADGALRFAGGLTTGRGMQGESVSLDTLERAILDPLYSSQTAPAFGCALVRPGEAAWK